MSDPTPLDFLKAVYLDPDLPLSVRMRAATEAAPYCHPKLSASALIDPLEFAQRLDRAVERSGVRYLPSKSNGGE
jgi:hypothetical protein